MYNCDMCTKTIKSGEKQNKVIIETREKLIIIQTNMEKKKYLKVGKL